MKLALLTVLLPICALASPDAPRVYPTTQVDSRVELIRSLHEGSGFTPYTDQRAWRLRAEYLHQQVLIAAGLWPLPPRTPLNAAIYGTIDRGDYTVEKVHFESYPGFFVTGNLYRPKGRKGPFPAVLCPHGHWTNGRLYEAPDKVVAQQIAGHWETDPNAAKYPMQARAANLAKLGCVVFFYDMVGYADADPEHFPHRKTYLDVDSDLHLLSVFGLQCWDSIRAIDFVTSLPDVDANRVACTGASGGATQTIMLMADDDRLAVAGPVCMISAGEHQGGCVCENNSLLRVGTDNVELAATFAPRPFIHPTATGDWTAHFLEQGFPQIKATYALFGAPDNVESFRQTAEHNYNLASREAVYNFFNKHLRLGNPEPIHEQPFQPVAPKDLSVWDAEHLRPTNSVDAPALKSYWLDMTAKQIDALKPKDADGLRAMRAVLEPALRHIVSTRLPSSYSVVADEIGQEDRGAFVLHRLTLRRREDQQAIPALLLSPKKPMSGRRPKLYVSPGGKADFIDQGGEWSAGIQKIAAVEPILLIDVYGTGELSAKAPANKLKPVEFFAGYNRTPLANRVHDTLTAITFLRAHEKATDGIDLVAAGDAGLWCLLAKALAGDSVHTTTIGGSGLTFTVPDANAPHYLPGSLRYGGVGPFAALCAPGELHLNAYEDAAAIAWIKAAYHAAGADDKLHITPPPQSASGK
jgi:dienelactone hydrolase